MLKLKYLVEDFDLARQTLAYWPHDEATLAMAYGDALGRLHAQAMAYHSPVRRCTHTDVLAWMAHTLERHGGLPAHASLPRPVLLCPAAAQPVGEA